MKAKVLHISEHNFVSYMLDGSEDIFEMYATAAMVREVNENCHITNLRQANDSELSNTLFAYHRISGKNMKDTKIMQLCRKPNLSPMVKTSLIKRVNTVREGESFRFTFIEN